jgi:hypothetical protein
MLARVLSSLARGRHMSEGGDGAVERAAQIEPVLTALVPNTQQELPGLFRS